MEMIEKLNKMFVERYSKQLQELNSNLYVIPKADDNTYTVPYPTLVGNGFTGIARVRISERKVKPVTSTFRIGVSISEAEIASRKPEYFAYLFDATLKAAIVAFTEKLGGTAQSRFGSHFIKATPMTLIYPSTNSDAEELVEFKLTSDFAGEELA